MAAGWKVTVEDDMDEKGSHPRYLTIAWKGKTTGITRQEKSSSRDEHLLLHYPAPAHRGRTRFRIDGSMPKCMQWPFGRDLARLHPKHGALRLPFESKRRFLYIARAAMAHERSDFTPTQ
jgi:hypothetical protein